MNYKFKYAAGLPGYGINGIDGSVGLAGFAMYVLNIPESGNEDFVENQIRENKRLMSSGGFTTNDNIPGYPLRKYQNNDTFIDKEGKIFIITNAAIGAYEESTVALGSGEFLDDIAYGYNDQYLRYANVNQPLGEKKLLDTVFGDDKSYFTYPSDTLYGISPRDFGKIFHSSEVINGYNPYYLFNTNINEAKWAMALVRDNTSGQFRLGNLSSVGLERDTNLNFDIHFLTQTNNGTQYRLVSRFDHDASALFGIYFDTNTSAQAMAFQQIEGSVLFSWDISLILNTSNFSNLKINAVIHPVDMETIESFGYENGAIKSGLDQRKYATTIIENVSPQSSVNVTDLDENVEYAGYLEFVEKGWVRRTRSVRYNFTGGFKYIAFQNVGTNNTIIAKPTGETAYILNIISNTNWKVTGNNQPSWVHINSATMTGTSGLDTLEIMVDPHRDNHLPREASITIKDENDIILRTLWITQEPMYKEFDSKWWKMNAKEAAKNDSSFELYVRKVGKVCTIQGRFKPSNSMAAGNVIANIDLHSLYDTGEIVAGSSRDIKVALGSQIGTNDANNGDFAVIPSYGNEYGDGINFLYLLVDTGGAHSTNVWMNTYYSVNATFYLD